jgi:dipeptidyl aminopeptidase/acylaminoacyl peptidase
MSTAVPQKSRDRKSTWIWLVAGLLILLLILFVSQSSSTKTTGSVAKSDKAGDKASVDPSQVSLKKPDAHGGRLGEEWPPKLKVIFTYDSVTVNGKTRSLVAKQRDTKFVPDSDSSSGFDLWVVDENGHERLVDSSVYRAKFSPDGNKIAYATSEAMLRVEDLQGKRTADVNGGYDPNWSPDGKSVVFAKVPPGKPNIMPGTLQLALVDAESGGIKTITDGRFDDVRPEFDPTGKNILFVSGGRTGLASFWMVTNPDEPPVQITNLGQENVDEKFVPTPYSPYTLWSKDGHWFIYDFKQGDKEQTWGLKFDGSGKVQPIKLADGTQPHWKVDGHSFICQTSDGRVIEAKLP